MISRILKPRLLWNSKKATSEFRKDGTDGFVGDDAVSARVSGVAIRLTKPLAWVRLVAFLFAASVVSRMASKLPDFSAAWMHEASQWGWIIMTKTLKA